ncbi:MAG: hypothetical protein LQ340_001650 [Diploschistes diacapsis]|nr:MAG: hypothetical protein LQ340_001650 [Diploschistes diacapsis]
MGPTFDKPIAIIQGVGPGTGSSIARKFAKKYAVVLLARTPASYEAVANEIESDGGQALGIPTDVSRESDVSAAFDTIHALGPNGTKPVVAAAVMNGVGGFVRKPFLELTTEEFLGGYEASGRGTFLFAKAVLPLLLEGVGKAEHPPTLLFTGATASVKGSANFASFASGKWAVRAIAQSLGREFGPKGVHVAHAVIDG